VVTEEPSAIDLAFVNRSDERLLEAIVTLADQNRATLGLMPRGAFPQIADKGELLAATTPAGDLAGYALFAVARGRVRLIHLCVADAFRRQGVATGLIRKVSETHNSLAAITLKCRRDFPANEWWPRLGFAVRGEVIGRGKDGVPLVVWVRSHGIPDLFTFADEPVGIPVAIDHNVFVDLAIKPEGKGADESKALLADWIAEQITLTVTEESRNEINRIEDPIERQRQWRALDTFPSLHHTARAHDEARDRWDKAVGAIPRADKSDCNHIVNAAAGGAHVFVTRDERVINRYGDAAAEVFGMRVLHPAELIAHLDEIAHAVRYRPVELRGTGFTVSQFGVDAGRELDGFLDNAAGERKLAYHALVRRIAADTAAVGTWVRDPGGRVVAAWAIRPTAEALEVPMLRAERSAVGATVGRLIAFELRQRAVERGLRTIRVTEPHLPSEFRSDLLADGFAETSSGLVAAVLDASTRDELRQAAEGHELRESIRTAMASACDRRAVLSLERALWPVKLLDSDLPSYLVPIRPRWAQDLFDLNPTLFERPGLLGISREHVYYRTPKGNPKSPARIGWYGSSDRGQRIGAVVAVSHLVDVTTDSASRLYRRYQHLGVYSLKDVQASERGGMASALRFVDTETLPKPVSLEHLRTLEGGRLTGTLQSPTMITSALFGALYREGTGRGR